MNRCEKERRKGGLRVLSLGGGGGSGSSSLSFFPKRIESLSWNIIYTVNKHLHTYTCIMHYNNANNNITHVKEPVTPLIIFSIYCIQNCQPKHSLSAILSFPSSLTPLSLNSLAL